MINNVMIATAKQILSDRKPHSEESLVEAIAPQPKFPIGGDESARETYHAAMERYWIEIYHQAVQAIRQTGAKAMNRGLNCYAWTL